MKPLSSNIDTWFLPDNSKLNIEKNYQVDTMPFQIPIIAYNTKLTISNPNFNFTIYIENTAPYAPLDRLYKEIYRVDKYFSQEEIWTQSINITFSAEFNPNQSITEYTALQYNWIKDFINRFKRDFDWNLIKEDI